MVFDSKQMASKFLDGDLRSNTDFDQLVADKKTKETFSRYQLISHIIKDDAVAPDVCLAESIMSSLSNEATVLAPKFEQKPVETDNSSVVSFPIPFGKQIGGMAIAASVALVALLNFGGPNTDLGQNLPQALASTETAINVTDPSVTRAEMQQAHQLFMDFSINNQSSLPVIQTVSNQKAVAITVVPNKTSKENSEVNSDDKKDQ